MRSPASMLPAFPAVAFAMALCLGAPQAEAFGFGRNKGKASQTTPAERSAPEAGRAAPQAPEPPQSASAPVTEGSAPAAPEPPATPAERRAARSLDLVAQANFWLAEFGKAPADKEAAVEGSLAFRRIGSHDRAAEMASLGLQSHPNDPALWSAMSLALVSGAQYEAAVQALTRAIALSPNDPALRSGLGIAYDQTDQPALARAAYEAGLLLAPDDVAILTNYGLSKALAGDLAGGEAMLRRAAARPLAPAQARQNLALVVGLQGRFEESERIASADLPASVAAENVAYLRQMLNGGDSRWARAGAEQQ